MLVDCGMILLKDDEQTIYWASYQYCFPYLILYQVIYFFIADKYPDLIISLSGELQQIVYLIVDGNYIDSMVKDLVTKRKIFFCADNVKDLNCYSFIVANQIDG